MLRLALLFLVIALAAGLFGFDLVPGLRFEAAQILFFVFLVLSALVFLRHLSRRPGSGHMV